MKDKFTFRGAEVPRATTSISLIIAANHHCFSYLYCQERWNKVFAFQFVDVFVTWAELGERRA